MDIVEFFVYLWILASWLILKRRNLKYNECEAKLMCKVNKKSDPPCTLRGLLPMTGFVLENGSERMDEAGNPYSQHFSEHYFNTVSKYINSKKKFQNFQTQSPFEEFEKKFNFNKMAISIKDMNSVDRQVVRPRTSPAAMAGPDHSAVRDGTAELRVAPVRILEKGFSISMGNNG